MLRDISPSPNGEHAHRQVALYGTSRPSRIRAYPARLAVSVDEDLARQINGQRRTDQRSNLIDLTTLRSSARSAAVADGIEKASIRSREPSMSRIHSRSTWPGPW